MWILKLIFLIGFSFQTLSQNQILIENSVKLKNIELDISFMNIDFRETCKNEIFLAKQNKEKKDKHTNEKNENKLGRILPIVLIPLTFVVSVILFFILKKIYLCN